jgi:Sulfatase-modifying factor enzyme 1
VRAGSVTPFFTGPNVTSLDGYVNISDAYLHDHKDEVPYSISNFSFEVGIHDGFATTVPVASFKPNAFGLYDMIGNVMEWCDGICPAQSSPHQRFGEPSRPIRGRNWAATLPIARSAARHGDSSGSGYDGVGFRAMKRLEE